VDGLGDRPKRVILRFAKALGGTGKAKGGWGSDAQPNEAEEKPPNDKKKERVGDTRLSAHGESKVHEKTRKGPGRKGND